MSKQMSIARRFLRSVNLSRDSKSDVGLAGYIITASAREALSRIGLGLAKTRNDRAFTLTGPYGSGKSSFALFLFQLLQYRDGDAWKMLFETDIKLAKEFHNIAWPKQSLCGYACLVVTAAMRQSIQEILADAIESYSGPLPTAVESLSLQLRQSRDTRDAMRLIEEIVKAFCNVGYCGVLFVIDEFGRVFENARIHPSETEVSLLQDLAEAASRSGGDTGLALLGILHQGVGGYAASDPSLRREFMKIEGRFEPIVFAETPGSQIRLIASAINSDTELSPEDVNVIKKAIDSGVPKMVGLADNDFERYARLAYPLHPLTLAALPVLFKRLGQNERSVFSYIAGNEPMSLSNMCSKGTVNGLICLDCLYDYIFNNFEVNLSHHSFGQAILDANGIISSKDSLSNEDKKTLKSVALLSSLGTQCPINATLDMIRLAIAPLQLTESLGNLKKQSILVYRKFNKTYALWGGSDVDLEDCERRADEELGKSGFSLAETLNKFVPPEPMVAKRHSLETGTLRFFETCYADIPAILEDIRKKNIGTASGLLVVCLPERESEVETFLEEAERVSQEEPSLVFAVPLMCGDLREALKEVRRLHWIEDNEKALRDDKIARREVSVRLTEATQNVIQRQFGLLDPRPVPHGAGCVFVCSGNQQKDIHSGRDLSRLLSDICDKLYSLSPRVRNELINRRLPSSQAASARNTLVKRLNNPETISLKLLGIEGYPPERSIYESVILASGMHVEGNDGKWCLAEPKLDTITNLRPAWDKLFEIVFADNDAPVSLKYIYRVLSEPPYGMVEGLLPLFVIMFYLVNKNEMSMYYEGTFLPDPQDANFELLVRRPELFALSGMRISGTRAAIVKRLATGLGAANETVMPVVRKLYGMMNNLSKYARETNTVSERAQAFRKAFDEARSPEILLFRTLPKVFGLDRVSEKDVDSVQLDSYFACLNSCLHELGGALPKLVSNSRKVLLETCGFENSADGWRLFYDRCCYLLARIGTSSLTPLLRFVQNTDGKWTNAVQVMSYIQQTPMDKWGPLQIREFTRNVKGIAEQLKSAWEPFDGTVLLSDSDEKSATSLLADIRAAAKSRKTGRTALRAALLRALAELTQGEKP